MKIAIFATHPIQYHIPWFRELSGRPGHDIRVYYACVPNAEAQGAGFDIDFNWDIPMFEGYHWKVLESRKDTPRIDGFWGNSVKNLRQLLKQEKPDVVILTGWQALPLLQALFWCVIQGIPRIVRGESNGMKPRSWKVRFVHRMLLPWYNSFLTIGKANRQFYRGYGVSENKMFHCSYFVENQRLLEQARAVEKEHDNLREKWSIPHDAVCFLYMGKLVEKKRIQDQLAAMELALTDNANLHLLVVGTGELMDAAKQQVKIKQLPVSFAGFLNQTEITRAYVAADCLILSSDYDETWGLVVNEAMACGLPAIVSDRAGSGLDLIEDGVTGGLYTFANVQALADKMLDLARDHERMRKMGRNAQTLVLRDYTVKKAVDGTLEAVESVAR